MTEKKLKLSKSQSDCIEAARANNERLYRYGTGLWSRASAELDEDGYPVWYFRHSTIKSLIVRRIFEQTNFIKAPGFRSETFMTVCLRDGWESLVEVEE